ncbi:MAG: polysaccharide pyruvyl transferase family protein [Jhaorihella sp.]
MLKVALIGHDLRNDNLGVGALSVAQTDILRKIARRHGLDLRILVLEGGGPRDPCISGPDISERVVRPLRRPWQFFSVIRSSDLVIDISGGDSFTDIYGRRRMFQVFLQKFLTHLAGRPLAMAPQTIGPFTGRAGRFLAARTIDRCAVVATRDDRSLAFARALGVTRGIVEASDVALRLPYERPDPAPEGPVRVGLNVSGLLMGGGYTGKNEFGLKLDYPGLIRGIVKGFLSRGECELHLVGHVISTTGREDDYSACKALAAEFPRAIVAPAFATPSEAKSYIAGLDFFMGARMHACIAAFSSGVPVVPMAYSRKFEGLFASLGYLHTVDCTGESADAILEKILAAYEDRQALAGQARTALELGLQRLDRYEDALEALLLETAAKRA